MRQLRAPEEQAAYLEQRQRDLGITAEMLERCRNSGRRRTASKRALLRKLDELAAERGGGANGPARDRRA